MVSDVRRGGGLPALLVDSARAEWISGGVVMASLWGVGSGCPLGSCGGGALKRAGVIHNPFGVAARGAAESLLDPVGDRIRILQFP